MGRDRAKPPRYISRELLKKLISVLCMCESADATLQLANVNEIIYGPIIFAAKVSILLQFLRIFVPTRKDATYWAIHFLIWTNLFFYTIVTFVFIFQCSPREKIWNPRVSGKCLNTNLVFLISGAWNILSDVSILVLPIHSIFKLHLPLRRKIEVSAIFAIGLL